MGVSRAHHHFVRACMYGSAAPEFGGNRSHVCTAPYHLWPARTPITDAQPIHPPAPSISAKK